MTFEEWHASATHSLDLFNRFINESSLFNLAKVDHICYKCSSTVEFESLRATLESESAYIYQSFIAERRIAVICLKKIFPSSLGDIAILELSDQKPDGSQRSGFDHIEIFPTQGTIPDLLNHIKSKNFVSHLVERPHHTTWDISIADSFRVRIEPEALIEKIKREEMKEPALA